MVAHKKALNYSDFDTLFEKELTHSNGEWHNVLSDIASVTSDLNEKLDNGYKDWGNVQKLYKEVFNIINVPMMLLNRDIVVCANKAFCERLGIKLSDIFHKDISVIVHPKSHDLLQENCDCLMMIKHGKHKWKNTHIACSPIKIEDNDYTLIRLL